MTTLNSLESVRLVFLLNPHLKFNLMYHARKARAMSLPYRPEYAFCIDVCPALLKAPRIEEFRVDAFDAFQNSRQHGNFQSELQKLCIASGDNMNKLLRDVLANTELETLVISTVEYRSNEYDDELDPDSEHHAEVLNMLVKEQASSLRALDIADYTIDSMATQRLSCIPDLCALEHLRIGLLQLSTNKGLETHPLEQILPARLKTLTITDEHCRWIGAIEASESEFSDDGSESSQQLRPAGKPNMELLSRALDRLSQTYKETHLCLRSVTVLGHDTENMGFRLEPGEAASASQAQPAELPVVEPGRVVLDGGRIKEKFAQFGVTFRELFYGHEVYFPFSAVHAKSYI